MTKPKMDLDAALAPGRGAGSTEEEQIAAATQYWLGVQNDPTMPAFATSDRSHGFASDAAEALAILNGELTLLHNGEGRLAWVPRTSHPAR